MLIESGHAKTAKAYILYRHERAKLRKKRDSIPEDAIELVIRNKKKI